MGGIARRRLFGALGVVGAVVVGTRAEALFATAARPAATIDRPATIARVQAARLHPPARHGWQGSSIGNSVEGRSIVMWTQRATRERDHVLVIGAIHGNEPVTRPIAEATADVNLPAGTTLSIIPTANPDGWAHNRRRNARGVDLNRNFPWRWSPADGGPTAASAPETVALMHAILTIRPDLVVWIHQPLNFIAPILGCPPAYADAWCGATNTPRRLLLDQHGGAETWTGRAAGVPSMLVEVASWRSTAAMVALHRRGFEHCVVAVAASNERRRTLSRPV